MNFETNIKDHNFFWKILEIEIEFSEIGPFQKMAKNFICVKYINYFFT